jgi:hypothetical protein
MTYEGKTISHVETDGPRTPADHASRYLADGLCPIPVKHRGKKPIHNGWTKMRVDSESISSLFGSQPCNIGIVLGHLTD